MPWELTGNAGTTPGTNFLGTTDGKPLIINTNPPTRNVSNGNVGIWTTSPTNALHVNSTTGIRQNRLYLSGGDGWSSLTYNAYHNDAGTPWIFPDSSHKGVTIEMDDSNGLPRFQVWSTTSNATTSWIQRFGIDGDSGNVFMGHYGGNVGIGTAGPTDKLDIIAPGTYSNIEFQGHPLEISTGTSTSDYTLYMGADKNNKLSYIQSVQVGIAVVTLALNPRGGNVGIGTPTPDATLTVNGNVSVTGDVILTGADCAEEFDMAEAAEIEPGIVVVFDQGGIVQQCRQAYDKRVAGVVSGAGDYQPGLILDRQQLQENRVPVALVGKVYCKVDAQYAPIEVGDLLTTSPTPGHAMKVVEPQRAFGTIIGKAMDALKGGQGLIPILIALQ